MTAATTHSHVVELRKEALTTALYVSICLLAALIALPEDADEHVFGVIWGVTIGLALAHWFAFRVSARLVGAGRVSAEDVASGSVQVGAAAAVALLASIAVAVFAETAEREAAQLTLAALIGVVGFAVARAGGARRGRALAYGLVVLVIAVAIAQIKNRLAGH